MVNLEKGEKGVISEDNLRLDLKGWIRVESQREKKRVNLKL